MNFNFDPIFLLSILIAVSIHEWAHAFVADRLGDPTARDQGRLTINPIAHLDVLGTILFFVAGFGWGKPVPVDPSYFRHPLRDSALVAIAGPLSNLVITFVCLVVASLLDVFHMPAGVASDLLTNFLRTSVLVNLGLMAFNLLPIPPLDGSRILEALLPWRARLTYLHFAQYSQWVLLGLIIAENFLNIPILSLWVISIAQFVLAGMDLMIGLVF